MMTIREKEQSFLDAVRVYQHGRRDNDLSYGYPMIEQSSIHGMTRGKQYWVLRDAQGILLGAVSLSGKELW